MGAVRLHILQTWDEILTAVARAENRTVSELKTQNINDFMVTLSNFEKHQNQKKNGRS